MGFSSFPRLNRSTGAIRMANVHKIAFATHIRNTVRSGAFFSYKTTKERGKREDATLETKKIVDNPCFFVAQ